jgi:hypothetical protein
MHLLFSYLTTLTPLTFQRNSEDLAPDSDCRNYDLSSTEVKALSGGYRHLEAFDTKMQFVLAAPLQVTEGQTYWVRVRFRDGTTPTANVNGCTGSEVGTLGQDAKDCNEQCTLSGLSANCNKGCEAAHPKYMNDENLCASMVCAESTACYADALKGCTFALDLEQEGSLIWTSNVGTSCANTLAAQIDTYQTEDGGLVFVPSLQGEVADEFTTTVSCVAETTLDDGMCSQYTCDRGKLIGLNGAGQYDGCDFQPSCVQGCLAPALFDHPEVGSLFLVDGVAEITEEGDKVVINCDPNFGDSVGDFVGKGTWMCTKDADNNFIWERQLENGGGDGKCIYVPEVVTVPVPITLDDQDIDNNGNIVPRTTTETSTTTTTTTTTTTLATTVTTAVVKRKTLEFRFNNVNIPEMATDSKFEFKKKVIGLITENSVLTEELDIAFVTFSAYSEAKDEERRQRREGDAPDQVDSIVTVHFVDSAPAVTDAVLASITNAIAASLETYTVSVNTLDGVKSLSEAPVAGTSNLGVAYQDEIQAALENEEAEGNDDYTDDEGGGGTTDVAAKQSLTGGEKFGLAILIIMILGMLAGIVWMVHKMQTHPKYKRQQLYGKSAQEAGTSMPMIDITSEDPFAVRGDSSTAIRSVQAQERQRKTSMLAPSKHPSAFSGPQASQIIVPTQPSMRGGRAPSGQPARNLDGFPRQVSARPRQVSVRQGPVSRTMTDDAELGLDAVAPTVFGATQASIRPTNHGGAISQAKEGGISRDRKATMFNQPDAGSLAPPAQPAGRPVSRVMNLEGFGGGGETEVRSSCTVMVPC